MRNFINQRQQQQHTFGITRVLALPLFIMILCNEMARPKRTYWERTNDIMHFSCYLFVCHLSSTACEQPRAYETSWKLHRATYIGTLRYTSLFAGSGQRGGRLACIWQKLSTQLISCLLSTEWREKGQLAAVGEKYSDNLLPETSPNADRVWKFFTVGRSSKFVNVNDDNRDF